MTKKNPGATSIIVALLCVVLVQFEHADDKYSGWKVAGGTKESIRYSSLAQIDTSNVSKLEIAWTYHTGDADTVHHSQIQCNPIIVNGVLFGTSPKLKVFAVDQATGKQKWIFDPFKIDSGADIPLTISINNNRGVTYWEGGGEERIFCTAGSYLFALDAKSGKLIASFGKAGRIDLHDNLERDVSGTYVVSTSPGIIYKDVLIVGTRVAEYIGAAPGHIRAYDVLSGKLRWIFHTIPFPGEKGFETWEDSAAYRVGGGANAWAGFSLDEARGILFAPIGSATGDFYGGKRTGADLFANCVLALDANTGHYKWHYQTVHHDVWDRDLPSAPSLVSVAHNGKTIDAVAQTTKTGFIFLLDRETGNPLFPIEEKTVTTNTEIFGEKLWPTQPVPVLPKPFLRQSFSIGDLNNKLPRSSRKRIERQFLKYKSGDLFTPPSTEGTIFFPGLEGGANWGGAAFDPESGLIYVNANEVPWVITLREGENSDPNETLNTGGKRLYNRHCASCHGLDKKGSGDNPPVFKSGVHYSAPSIDSLLISGRRMMPSFQHLTDLQRKAIITFIFELKREGKKSFVDPERREELISYEVSQSKFISKEGYPASKPPWGSLNAISLVTGQIVWKIPLGEYPELKKEYGATGTENYGGPVVTSGGLVFIAATRDKKFRAFNKRTGKLLWETELPAAGFATPSTYEVRGRQFIVIACGGGKLGTPSGDSYVAFALP